MTWPTRLPYLVVMDFLLWVLIIKIYVFEEKLLTQEVKNGIIKKSALSVKET